MDPSQFLFGPTPFELGVIALLDTTAPPGRYCAKNAVWHLNRAARIKDLDPEMAALRAITAEEESASALFHSIKRRHYAGAEKLKPRLHLHKNALVPFFQAIAETLQPVLESNPYLTSPQLVIDAESSPGHLRLQFRVRGDDTITATPEPPLNLILTENDKPFDYQERLLATARRLGFQSVQKHLASRAEQRTRLLYAEDTGPARLANPVQPLLDAFRKTVFRNLTLFLMIDPYAEMQPLVQHSVTAFLDFVGANGSREVM
jgi:hypothetical protein